MLIVFIINTLNLFFSQYRDMVSINSDNWTQLIKGAAGEGHVPEWLIC